MTTKEPLPHGWCWANVDQLGNAIGGVTKGRDLHGRSTVTMSYLRVANVQRGGLDLTEIKSIEVLAEEVERYLLRKGDVLLTEGGDADKLGRAALWKEEVETCIHQNHVFRVRLDSNILPQWLMYFANSPAGRAYFAEAAKQTVNLASINLTQLRSFPVPLAPLPEQHRIVDAIEQQFTCLDAGVAALKRVQATLKRYRAAVLKAAVEGKLTEAWRAVHSDVEPASKLLERILADRRARWEADLRAKGKDPVKAMYEEPKKSSTTELHSLPDSWCWATAEQLSDETRAITYGVIKLGEPVAGGVPTLRSSNVRHLRLELDTVKRISQLLANEYKRTFLEGGEILVTVRGTLGGVVAVPEALAGYNISREVAMIALVAKETGPCTALFMGSPPIQRWMMQNTKGIAYTGLNIESLKALPVPLAPQAEQEQVASEVEQYLSVATELEVAVGANLKRAERLRQSILERAFSGRLVPQDPDDESARVLLERIKSGRTTNRDVTAQELWPTLPTEQGSTGATLLSERVR